MKLQGGKLQGGGADHPAAPHSCIMIVVRIQQYQGFSRGCYIMRGSRKFCQRGSNLDNFFLDDEGREGPNTTLSRPSSARQ